jgi:peptidoglycan/LPS O-acetylase OafA/YrhL
LKASAQLRLSWFCFRTRVTTFLCTKQVFDYDFIKKYLATENINLKGFYFSRILRHAPTLALTIIPNNLVWNYIADGAHSNQQLATWADLFYAENFVLWSKIGFLITLWPLAVDEHFYLMWPPILAAFYLRFPVNKQINMLIF